MNLLFDKRRAALTGMALSFVVLLSAGPFQPLAAAPVHYRSSSGVARVERDSLVPVARPQADTLSEAVVTGTRLAVDRDLLPAPVSVVGRSVLENRDASSLLPALMEQVPGLFVTSRGVTGYGVSGGAAGAISLRGFDASTGRVLVLIDGHPQYETIYGHPVADQYFSENALKVEVTRGPASVLYGSGAMGGAINIITRRPPPGRDAYTLDVKLLGGSWGTARASAASTVRKGALSVSVDGVYDRTDGHRPNSAFRSRNGGLRLGYELSKNWSLNATGSLMNAYSQNPGDIDAPMIAGWSDVTRGVAGLSVDNDYGWTSGSISLSYSGGKHVVDDGYKAGGTPRPYLFNGTDYLAAADLWQSFRLFKGNHLTAGFSAQFYGGNAYRNPVTEIYADHVNMHDLGLYVVDQYRFGRFMANLGVRMDVHSRYGLIVLPQAGLSWQPFDATTFKISAGRGFRAPNMRELYMYAVANEDLLPEDAWSYDFTYVQKALEGRLNAELSVYYTKGGNIIEVTTVDGKRQNRNAGAFRNAGVELAASWQILSGLSVNTNYSWTYMAKTLVGVPEHKFHLGASYKVWQLHFQAGATLVGNLWLATGAAPVKETYVDVNARIAWRPLDWLEVFVRGDNLAHQRYRTMLGFPVPGITGFGGLRFTLSGRSFSYRGRRAAAN